LPGGFDDARAGRCDVAATWPTPPEDDMHSDLTRQDAALQLLIGVVAGGDLALATGAFA
jgi:hypothetical protein